MKKYLLLLLLFPSFWVQAQSTRSLFLDQLPRKCDSRTIINEIPFISDNHFNMGEVLDITNVSQILATPVKLECKAMIKSNNSALNGMYNISFNKNSIGDIIINYQKSR